MSAATATRPAATILDVLQRNVQSVDLRPGKMIVGFTQDGMLNTKIVVVLSLKGCMRAWSSNNLSLWDCSRACASLREMSPWCSSKVNL
ncbi:hypothetical protein HD806DRAFT_242268 [Xylariaceae sp. AK1471]|nr:hypothetical protein HD806DRAFT_242268 [Xylariaceae sp. AK1471]